VVLPIFPAPIISVVVICSPENNGGRAVSVLRRMSILCTKSAFCAQKHHNTAMG